MFPHFGCFPSFMEFPVLYDLLFGYDEVEMNPHTRKYMTIIDSVTISIFAS